MKDINRFNIGAFLKKHNAIMAYMYDHYGFKRGVIIATPGDKVNKQPHIGFAFFDEVIPRPILPDGRAYVESYVGDILDIPLYNDTFKRHGLDVLDSEVRRLPWVVIDNIRQPLFGELRLSEEDYLRDTILLAYERRNANYQNHYLTSDITDRQYLSNMDGTESFKFCDCHIEFEVKKPFYVADEEETEDSERVPAFDSYRDPKSIVIFRQKIKSFEYRALRYYGYVQSDSTL